MNWDGSGALSESLTGSNSFFASLDQTRTGYNTVATPSVIYDPYAQRFWVTAEEGNGTAADNVLDIAVSTSDAPTFDDQSWLFYSISIPNGIDPRIAADGTNLYVSTNQGTSVSAGADIYRLNKALMIDNQQAASSSPAPIVASSAYSLLPVQSFGRQLTDPQLFIESDPTNNSGLDVWELSSDGTLSQPPSGTLSAPFTPYSPSGAPQQGTSVGVDTIDARITSAMYRNGAIWAAQTVSESGQAAVRWYEITDSSGTYSLAQTGNVVPLPGAAAYDPAIAVDASGDMGLTYTVSSPGQYPTMMYTAHQAGDPAGTTEPSITVQSSSTYIDEYTFPSGSQTVSAWGRYAGMAVDPGSSSTFWALGEYAAGTTQWGAAWGEFTPQTGGLHVTSVSVANGGYYTSLPGGDIVVTFNHQLAGLTENDPTGGGFANHPWAVTLVPRGPDGTFTAPSGVDSGNLPVPATLVYTVNGDTSQITLTPDAPLDTDVYLVQIDGGLTDTAGNALEDAAGNTGIEFTTFELQVSAVDSSTPTVTSVSADHGTVVINNNSIPQPDAVAVHFSKPMDALTINSSTIGIQYQQSPGVYVSVPGVVAYNPGTEVAYYVPTGLLVPGTIYYLHANSSISDNQSFPNPGHTLGSTYYTSFEVSGSAVGQGQGPLAVVSPNNVPETVPASQASYTNPLTATFSSLVGYATITMDEPVSRASLARYSVMLIPESGGTNHSAFDFADAPVNAKLAINANTNQIVILPTVPLGSDAYEYILQRPMDSANADGSDNTSDPLTDPTNGTYFKSWFQNTNGATPHTSSLPVVSIEPGYNQTMTEPSPFSPLQDTITFTRTGDTSGSLTAYYTQGVDDTAIPGQDYQGMVDIGGQWGVIFQPGHSTATVTLSLMDDDSSTETSNTESLSLTLLSGQYGGGYTTSGSPADITIQDSDAPAPPPAGTVSITPGSSTTTDEGGDVTLTVSRSGGDPNQQITVPLQVIPSGAILGTDYTSAQLSAGSVTIPAGSNNATIVIQPLQDDSSTESSASEWFKVQVSAPAGYSVDPTYASASVQINDLDTVPTVALQATTSSTSEGAQQGDYGVYEVDRMGGDTSQPLTVNFTINSNFNGAAYFGTDFTLEGATVSGSGASGSVTIPGGSNSVQFYVVPGDDDSSTETSDTETVQLALAQGTGYQVSSYAPQTVTINDTDSAPPSLITATATEPDTSEGSPDPGIITVSRTGDDSSAVTVVAIIGGSAIEPDDYTITGVDYNPQTQEDTVTIPAGDPSVELDVVPGDDNSTNEKTDTETVYVFLSQVISGTGQVDTSDNQAEVTINDTDVGTPPGTPPQSPAPGSSPGAGPQPPEAGGSCPCTNDAGMTQTAQGASGGMPDDSMKSPGGTDYASGAERTVSTVGIQSSGFGMPFGQELTWTNQTDLAANGVNGNGWVNTDLPSIQQLSGGVIMAVQSGESAVWFNPDGKGGYTTQFFLQDTLAPDGSSGDFVETDSEGDQIRYYGFESGIPVSQQGQFKSFTDPAGNAIAVTAHEPNGQIAQIQRSSTTNGVTTTESLDYTYFTSGPNAGLLQNVALSRQVGSGTPTTIRQAFYTYYDGTTANGNLNDLQTEVIEDGAGEVLDTSYYRYYTPGESGGYVGGLKYALDPTAYARLAAIADPLTASDTQVAEFADHYYQYDSDQRVILSDNQSPDSENGETGTYKYSYTTSSNPQGFNSWQTKTIETLPNGNQNIVYTNYAGEVMLKVFDDTTDPNDPTLQGKEWLTYDQYDNQGRLIEEADPSAVTGYNENSSDLAPVLAPYSGVINLHDYYTGATATAGLTTPGDVPGYAMDDKVQVGQFGTPVEVDSTQYFAVTAGGATVYPVATQTVYSGTSAETTSYEYSFFTGTTRIESTTTTLPVISTSQNGSAVANVSTTVYDQYGRVIWTRDADGFINYTAYDNATGAVITSITDVNTNDTGEFTNLPSGWQTPAGGGLNLVTQTVVDGLGRPLEITAPNASDGTNSKSITYFAYDDVNHEARTFLPSGLIEATRDDLTNGYTETVTLTGNFSLTDGALPGGVILSLERDFTNLAGQVIERDQYTNLNGASYSTSPYLTGASYNVTLYGYDDEGNLVHQVDAVGTITDTVLDGLDRPIATYVGTDDARTNPNEPWTPQNAASGSNMVEVSAQQYDGNGVGDGNLTQSITYPDSGNFVPNDPNQPRETDYVYDGRDRLVGTQSGVQSGTGAPGSILVEYALDNLGEITAVSQYDGSGLTLSTTPPSASLLRAYTTYTYDDQGRVYQTEQYDVSQTDGTYTYGLITNDYYGNRGNLVAESAPGGLWTKDQYDGAGRLIVDAQTDGASGTTWTDATSLAGDHVLTETLTTYDSDGNPTLVTTKDRFNTDTTNTGPLGGPTTAPYARDSYTANYFDAADRLIDSVDVGTNGGAGFTLPSSPPPRSDTALVTSYAYGPNGLVQTTTDPRGIQTQTSYDLLGEVTQTIQDYTNGTPTASSNATTKYTYNGIGDVTSVTAVQPSGTPSQTTAYVYGVTTAGGSDVNSNDLLATVEYPDPTTGNASTNTADQENYQYDALGDPIKYTDPNGTIHQYVYDDQGRQTSDSVTTLAPRVSGQVLRLETAYNALGLPSLYTSYSSASGGSGNIVNQVEDVYNGLGQLTGEYQSQSGAVVPGTTPEVQYTYTATATGNRLTSMIYPNGRTIDYVYNPGIDSAISRLSAIADDNNGSPGTILESYQYLGLSTIVERDHPQDGVNLSYLQQPGDSQYNKVGGDQYTGLDQFGRVIDQFWTGTSSGTAARFQYGYDRSGNVLYKNNLVDQALSELYHANSSTFGDSNTAYDGLGRLTGFARGVLSSSTNNGTQLDQIQSPTSSSSWGLDALGNFTGTTTNGTTAQQQFNADNQSTAASPGTAPPGFDRNGNTVADNNMVFIYDPWNRLVEVDDAGAPVAQYAYDALGRRITETSGATTNHLYYSPQWQVIEERQNGLDASNVTYQYVWSAAYVDGLVLRDTYSGGVVVPADRLYALQDANWNTVALVGQQPDGTWQVVEQYVYDPYGSVTVLDASGNPVAGNTSAYQWQYLFQGSRLDEVTGWYGKRERDYIPAEGRWAERDPLGLGAGDPNVYRYVNNSPSNLRDPRGEAWWVALGVGGAATATWLTLAPDWDTDSFTLSQALFLQEQLQMLHNAAKECGNAQIPNYLSQLNLAGMFEPGKPNFSSEDDPNFTSQTRRGAWWLPYWSIMGSRTYLSFDFFRRTRPDGLPDYDSQLRTLLHEAYHAGSGDFTEDNSYDWADNAMACIRSTNAYNNYIYWQRYYGPNLTNPASGYSDYYTRELP